MGWERRGPAGEEWNKPAMPQQNRQKIQVSRQWLELLEELRQAPRRIMIVGPADSGKSTLASWLGRKLAEVAPTGMVDGDVGQSQIGPPATVGWRLAGSAQEQCYFVGDVSPASRPATALSALLRAVGEAEAAGAAYSVIDTTGYIEGDAAVALKTAKVELLAPLEVLVIGDERPARRLLKCWQNFTPARIRRLNSADRLQVKTVVQRRQHRQQIFAAALADSNMRWVGLDDKAIFSSAGARAEACSGLLLGFIDEMRRLVCLGLLESLDLRNHRLLAYSPESAEAASGIVFGAIALNPAGEQLAQVAAGGTM